MTHPEAKTLTYAAWKLPERGSWLWIFTDAADMAADEARRAKDPKKRKLLWAVVATIVTALVVSAFPSKV